MPSFPDQLYYLGDPAFSLTLDSINTLFSNCGENWPMLAYLFIPPFVSFLRNPVTFTWSTNNESHIGNHSITAGYSVVNN